MPTKLTMPLLGEAVTEATVTKWLKNVGEKVEEYEPLLEVNTDKVDTEIPSPTSGVILAAIAKEGEVVKVGEVLGWIGQEGEAVPEAGASVQPAHASPQSAPSAPQAATVPAQSETKTAAPKPTITQIPAQQQELEQGPTAPRELGFISPVVAKIAAEQNVDLSKVPGTGMGGRITKKDIQTFLGGKTQATPQPGEVKPAVEAPTPSVPPTPTPALTTPTPTPSSGEYTVRPQTTMRKAIAEHMLKSEHTAPHVSTIMEVDMSRVVAHRNANKEAFSAEGVNLTFTAYFVLASVAALKAFPMVNSSYAEEGVRIFNAINIGMATALGEEGLIVPVIKNADNLSLSGVARTVNDLSNRARAHRLQPDEVRGGTFTITNHGVSGSLFATPIINQPQCAILGVGVIQKRAIVLSDPNLGDVIAIRPMMYLSLTFDHRIIDGAIADYFLGKIVETLEKWT